MENTKNHDDEQLSDKEMPRTTTTTCATLAVLAARGEQLLEGVTISNVYSQLCLDSV
jgi:hypothetical protein